MRPSQVNAKRRILDVSLLPCPVLPCWLTREGSGWPRTSPARPRRGGGDASPTAIACSPGFHRLFPWLLRSNGSWHCTAVQRMRTGEQVRGGRRTFRDLHMLTTFTEPDAYLWRRDHKAECHPELCGRSPETLMTPPQAN